MAAFFKKPSLFLFLAGSFLITLDQWSKWFAERTLAPHLFCNNGISLSIPLPIEVTLSISVLLFAFLAFLLYKAIIQKSPHEYIGFSCILFGAFSNAADRLLYGCVRDFLPFFELFTFNIADATITAGVLWIAFFIFFKKPVLNMQ